MLKLNYPDLENLSEEEKDSLGKIWLPFFNKYLSDKYSEILIPVFATAGIFLPKITQARKIKKSKQLVSETQTNEIPDHLKAEAEQIKKNAIEKERKEKELRENPTSQESQKIKDAIAQNDALPKNPKLGEERTSLVLPDGTKVE